MNPYRWFPALTPRHSLESVVRELIQGLRDGSITLDRAKPPDGIQAESSSSAHPLREKAATNGASCPLSVPDEDPAQIPKAE